MKLFLCGDVMTGRGIDQILPHPVEPTIYEEYTASARAYVSLAEQRHGPIPRPVDYGYIWGDALAALDSFAPDLQIVNLETSITTSNDAAPRGINYRMHPDNVGCLTEAGIDCAVLANNHVLDWGTAGLTETIATLKRAGIVTAGAGRNAHEAASPAICPAAGGYRLLVFGFGSPSSGIPWSWRAAHDRPSVCLLDHLSPDAADRIAENIGAHRQPGDVVAVSIHWGGNWGYDVPPEQRTFARRLIDSGAVDVVHGHSSHLQRAWSFVASGSFSTAAVTSLRTTRVSVATSRSGLTSSSRTW